MPKISDLIATAEARERGELPPLPPRPVAGDVLQEMLDRRATAFRDVVSGMGLGASAPELRRQLAIAGGETLTTKGARA